MHIHTQDESLETQESLDTLWIELIDEDIQPIKFSSVPTENEPAVQASEEQEPERWDGLS